jgi:class 3 adenylate cyclase/tetratricopeptide (TPR) repeat protein
VSCPGCGTTNAAGQRFCGECGARLALTCAACNAELGPGQRFCGECGTPTAVAPVAVAAATAVAERRLVTVLFADLVGYTALAEGRDFEDVRAIQDRYFETARSIIGRYGGTVEKFIGDAVMALWGAPVAREDDAERGVRAALELVDAITALGESLDLPGLRLRVGVLTGEAAVTLGAEGQGMVTGDLVNTASRIQSEAEPATVLVGDATRRAAEAAIVFADLGMRTLKGKTEPVPVFRALRVAAQRRGGGRSAGLEAPFVGRAAELRLVKELFHTAADEHRARLVSVLGVAGIGKSRLSWEFEKYIDGLAADIWWHRGRCLAYGDGVAFWALAEMVRGRARILEEDDATTAAGRLTAMLETVITDAEERAWVAPRLAHLLGLAERSAPDREDLFSAWRRFFERLADQGPLVLVFEDLHWADEGLVAFVEYLLDWGRHHPIFVLTLSRPEVADRHPGFPGATRSAATLPLEPLADAAMDELLTGLVPGLPDPVRARLREAADGIPLYAVETVRMLRDRGLIAQEGDAAVITGDLAALDVPETLHALIASRLDAVSDGERRLLQDASVLGKSFTTRGLAVVAGLDPAAVDQLVAQLVRKELLVVETDPFSPERGQLGFLQALVQRVTYETIARRDRRPRHLAAARYLATAAGIDPDEIAEVIASHYLDAHQADPGAPDRDEVRAEARRWFTRAADRATSLAASLEAQRAFERAADLAPDAVERGRSLARAGDLALTGGRVEEGGALLKEAIAILEEAGLPTEAASAQVRYSEVFFITGRIEEAVALLEQGLAAHEADGDERAIATVSAQLGRFVFFEGRPDEALIHVDRAIGLGERHHLFPVVVDALNTKGLALRGRPNESLGLMRQALLLAEEQAIPGGILRASMNLSYLLSMGGRESEADVVIERGLAFARLRGDRIWERSLATNLVSGYYRSGRWDEAIATVEELPPEGRIALEPVQAWMSLVVAQIALHRGQLERIAGFAAPIAAWPETASWQSYAVSTAARVLVALGEGRTTDAVRACREALGSEQGRFDAAVAGSLADLGAPPAYRNRDAESLADLVALLETAPFELPPALEAELAHHRARLDAVRGGPAPAFAEAAAALESTTGPFWAACARLEDAEWLAAHGRPDETVGPIAAARSVFERLDAAPYLARCDAVAAQHATA